MQSCTDNARLFFDTVDAQKIDLEISSQKWEDYYKSIIKKLGLKWYPELYLKNDYHKYCGTYKFIPPVSENNDQNDPNADKEKNPDEILYVIHIHNKRLCLNAFWPNLKLIPLKDNLFSVESFNFQINFNIEENKVSNLEFIEKNPIVFGDKEKAFNDESWVFCRVE
jgi:hypothetical protein